MNRQPHRRQALRVKGRRPDTTDLIAVDRYIGNHRPRRDHLIEYLHRIQDDLGHLPARLLVALADRLRVTPAEVYEVASFYHHFDVVREGAVPPPVLTVRVCDSISCALASAEALIAGLQEAVGDAVRIQRVPCVGRCDKAPVCVVGTRPVERATHAGVVEAVASEHQSDSIPAQARDLSTYRANGGYRQLQRLIARGEDAAESVIRTLEDARLRGLGGAGFPAGRKWRIVRGYPGPRLMAVNIDEGEPGTFKDRHLLENNPHQFLEGMLIAAHVVAVVEHLEIAVFLDHPGALLAHEGAQDRRCVFVVVVGSEDVADVMQQRADHHLLIGTITQRAGSGLQAMCVAIDRIAVVIALETPKMFQHTPAGIGLIFPEARIDQRPLGMRAFLETAKAGLLAHALASSLAN